MTVTRVTDLNLVAATKPGHRNRTVRLKYDKPQEILDEIKASRERDGRTDPCPISDYIENHLDDDVMDVEEAIWSDPENGPLLLTENIKNAFRFNNPSTPEGKQVGEMIQYDSALKLLDHPWNICHIYIEGLFWNSETVFVSKEALYILLSLIYKNHRYPKQFLSQNAIKDKLPADLELDRFG